MDPTTELQEVKQSPLPIKFYEKPYNGTRRCKISVFDTCLSAFKSYTNMSVNDRFALVEKIERACHNATVSKANEENIQPLWENDLFRDVYHAICYKISSNIEAYGPVKNYKFAKDIIAGNLNISSLPKQTSQELYPEKYADVLNRIEKSKNVTHSVKTSVMYKCRRCFKSECIIENRYNRSLDEGVNLSVQCVSCGLQWNA